MHNMNKYAHNDLVDSYMVKQKMKCLSLSRNLSNHKMIERRDRKCELPTNTKSDMACTHCGQTRYIYSAQSLKLVTLMVAYLGLLFRDHSRYSEQGTMRMPNLSNQALFEVSLDHAAYRILF